MMKASSRHIFCLMVASAMTVAAAGAQGPDLVIEDLYPPASSWAGATIHLQTAVDNIGDEDAAESTLRHSLSPLGTPDDTTDDSVIGECQLPAVPAGGRFALCSYQSGALKLARFIGDHPRRPHTRRVPVAGHRGRP